MRRPRAATLRLRIRVVLLLFMAALVLSGLTAVPASSELHWLTRFLGAGRDALPTEHEGLLAWLLVVRDAVDDTNARYPFLAYATDWLAFAHVVIAIAFVGPLLDPVRNRWVVTFGLIACAGVVPLALVAGALRGLPLLWRLIDCSFGVFGAIPLLVVRRDIGELESTVETVARPQEAKSQSG